MRTITALEVDRVAVRIRSAQSPQCAEHDKEIAMLLKFAVDCQWLALLILLPLLKLFAENQLDFVMYPRDVVE